VADCGVLFEKVFEVKIVLKKNLYKIA